MTEITDIPIWQTADFFKETVTGLFALVIGYFFLFHADFIGEHMTGLFVNGSRISAPTPGWMLWPFGLLLIAIGLAFTGHSVWLLFS